MAFLVVILAIALICGIPGVLFARLLRRAGFATWLALLIGNLMIPLVYIGAMTRGKLTEIPNTPWLFVVANFLGGLLFSLAYFRRSV